GAARPVGYQLEREATYKDWRKKWNANHLSEDRLIECMNTKRDREVHAEGAGLIVKQREIKVGVGGSYSDKSGTAYAMGSPSTVVGADTNPTILVPQYFFDVCGTERPVTEVCAEYLTVLEQMVAQYEADTSQ